MPNGGQGKKQCKIRHCSGKTGRWPGIVGDRYVRAADIFQLSDNMREKRCGKKRPELSGIWPGLTAKRLKQDGIERKKRGNRGRNRQAQIMQNAGKS